MCKSVVIVLIISITILMIASAKCQKEVLEIGNAVNLLKFQGTLSFTMRVFSSDHKWLFRQPSIKIFKQVYSAPRVHSESKIFSGDFHMEFCDNYQQLFQAYFRNFTIDGIDKTWHAFLGGWSKSKTAKDYGIRESLLSNDYGYIFVRISRFRNSYKLVAPKEGLKIDEWVLDRADNVTIGDTASTINFITNYVGTHYIESFTSGDSLFQVFVYKTAVFRFIKRDFENRGINILFEKAVTNYFTSDFAEFVSEIKTGSGNKTIEEWASINLFFPHQLPQSQNILRLYGDDILLKRLDNLLQNECLLQLSLKFIVPFFPTPVFSNWLVEFVSNNLKLWDVNL